MRAEPLDMETNRQAGATILCVDDEQNILSALRRLLRLQGYRVLTADSGHEGLEVLARETVDLVVSDMRMPQMSGAEFLEQVAINWPQTIRILLTGYADLESTVAAVNRGHIYRYVSKPWDDGDLKLTIKQGLELLFLERERRRLDELTRKQNAELRDLSASLEQKVTARTAELAAAMASLQKAHSDLKSSYLSSIKVFVHLLEMREKSVAGHSRRVAEQARALARKLGMKAEECEAILFAGLLHDIGKIGLPDHLLNKPFQSLTAPERELVIQHAAIGQAMMMSMDHLQGAAQLVRSHHERFDGKGFPQGLKGAAIPRGARILAAVNDFDALQSGALAMTRYTKTQAREFLRDNKGRRYDPEVVDAYLELLGDPALETERERERVRHSNDLQEGMMLARDLITREGLLLLSAGYTLDRKLIDKIRHFEDEVGYALTVYVSDPESANAASGDLSAAG